MQHRPSSCSTAVTVAQVAGVSALIRDGMMYEVPIMETTHMTESATADQGRLLLIAAR